MRRALKAARNLVLVLVSVEIVMQLASFAGRAVLGHSPSRSASPDEIVILCVGDSHTYGSPAPEEGYPVQLQATLDERFPEHHFRVLNLGLPGANSAFVANLLERQIVQLHPHLVIVWVGVNNLWNLLETEAWENTGVGTSIHRWLLRSKLYRMGVVSWHTWSIQNSRAQLGKRRPGERSFWTFGDEEVRHRKSEEDVASERITAGLSFDHDRMVATARALDTPILFINYPFIYKGVQRTIEESGKRLGVPVISSLSSFWRARADGHEKSELIVQAAGPHPRGLLHGYVVEDLMPHISRALAPILHRDP